MHMDSHHIWSKYSLQQLCILYFLEMEASLERTHVHVYTMGVSSAVQLKNTRYQLRAWHFCLHVQYIDVCGQSLRISHKMLRVQAWETDLSILQR